MTFSDLREDRSPLKMPQMLNCMALQSLSFWSQSSDSCPFLMVTLMRRKRCWMVDQCEKCWRFRNLCQRKCRTARSSFVGVLRNISFTRALLKSRLQKVQSYQAREGSDITGLAYLQCCSQSNPLRTLSSNFSKKLLPSSSPSTATNSATSFTCANLSTTRLPPKSPTPTSSTLSQSLTSIFYGHYLLSVPTKTLQGTQPENREFIRCSLMRLYFFSVLRKVWSSSLKLSGASISPMKAASSLQIQARTSLPFSQPFSIAISKLWLRSIPSARVRQKQFLLAIRGLALSIGPLIFRMNTARLLACSPAMVSAQYEPKRCVEVSRYGRVVECKKYTLRKSRPSRESWVLLNSLSFLRPQLSSRLSLSPREGSQSLAMPLAFGSLTPSFSTMVGKISLYSWANGY